VPDHLLGVVAAPFCPRSRQQAVDEHLFRRVEVHDQVGPRSRRFGELARLVGLCGRAREPVEYVPVFRCCGQRPGHDELHHQLVRCELAPVEVPLEQLAERGTSGHFGPQ
jgi:hypothetical protein